LQDKVQMGEAERDKIGMALAEIARLVAGNQVFQALAAGKCRVLFISLHKKIVGLLRIFVVAMRAG